MRASSPTRSGFSLVEVTIALGIVAFALVAVIGLLPTGLSSIKIANEQASAANVAASLAAALHASSYNLTSGAYKAFFPIDNQEKTLSLTRYEFPRLSLEGAEADDARKILSAVVDVKELKSPQEGYCLAIVSVAWSAQASPQWNSASANWTRADGQVTLPVLFLPRIVE